MKNKVNKTLSLVLSLGLLLGSYGNTYASSSKITQAYPVTGTTPSKPGYLESIIDPLFGSKITRVVDDSWGDVCRHHYSLDQAWNADQTVIWLNKGCDKFIDGNTYAVLPNLKFPPGEARWHPTDSKAMIYIKNNTLGKWNPFTGDNVILHIFSGYTNLYIGPSKGNLSNDGGMIVLYSTSSKKGFAYDILHNVKYPDIDLSAESRVDFVSISALGKYVIASVGDDSSKIFDLQGNQVGNWSEYGCPSHYDFTVDQNGDEVAVGVCKTGYNGIVKRRLSDGQITVIFPMGAGHTSARNIRRPGWVYVTGLYYAPYLNEILAIKLDGTAFERIAWIPNNEVDYESETHGSPSLDGKKVIVASNWNIGSRPVQSYVVEVVGANYVQIFGDVPFSYWAKDFIERLYNAGITGGCSTVPLNYCPDSTVTRAQMAIFLLKGMHNSSYTPPAVGASTGFADVATDYWAAAWIKQLAAEGITGGCGAGNYCPDVTVTRAQMAVFLLKAKYGLAYTPPAATGVFTDVPMGYWADKWIEQLAVEGITGGCGAGVYCPDSSVTRAQMAVFLVKMFNLP